MLTHPCEYFKIFLKSESVERIFIKLIVTDGFLYIYSIFPSPESYPVRMLHGVLFPVSTLLFLAPLWDTYSNILENKV